MSPAIPHHSIGSDRRDAADNEASLGASRQHGDEAMPVAIRHHFHRRRHASRSLDQQIQYQLTFAGFLIRALLRDVTMVLAVVPSDASHGDAGRGLAAWCSRVSGPIRPAPPASLSHLDRR